MAVLLIPAMTLSISLINTVNGVKKFRFHQKRGSLLFTNHMVFFTQRKYFIWMCTVKVMNNRSQYVHLPPEHRT